MELTLTVAPEATPGTLLAESSIPVNAMVEPAELSVVILPREFALVFETPSGEPLVTMARVLAGGSTRVGVALRPPGMLGPGERVVVSLTANTVTTAPFELTLTSVVVEEGSDYRCGIRRYVYVGDGEGGSARCWSGDDEGFGQAGGFDLAGGGGGRAAVPPVVSGRDGRFDLDGAGYRGCDSTSLRVRLSGVESPLGPSLLGEGETLTAELAYIGGTGVSVSPQAEFGAGNQEVVVSLSAMLDATPGTLTAMVGAAVNAMVEPAKLPVVILPRAFALVFAPPEVGIVPGGEETVELNLPEASLLPSDAVVTVELSLPPDISTVTLVTPATLTFDASTSSREVTLMASPDVGVGHVELLAMAAPGHGLDNAWFVDAVLPVNVVDMVAFKWVFHSVESRTELSEVVVVAGATTQFLVSLEGEQSERLAPGEQVEAVLTALVGIAVSPSTLVVSAGAMALPVTLSANIDTLTGGDLQLRLTRTTPATLSRDATVRETATLSVRVVREVKLVFEAPAFSREASPGVAIPDGTVDPSVRSMIEVMEPTTVGSLAVTVSITHERSTDLLITLVSPGGEEVILYNRAVGDGVDGLRATYTSREHAGLASLVDTQAQGEWVLTVGDYVIGGVGRLDRWGLAIDDGSGGPLAEMRVLAGGTTWAVVSLENPMLLSAGEEVGITLIPLPLTFNPSTLTLTVSTPRMLVAIGASHNVEALSGELTVSGQVLSSGAGVEVENTAVVPAALSVTVERRRFRLSLLGLSDMVVTYEVTPGLAIPEPDEMRRIQSVRSMISVAEGIAVGSLAVTVSITHERSTDLLITLVSPGGEGVILHNRAVGDSADGLRATYTSREHVGLASLVGTQAQGEWVLTVGDYDHLHGGTLDKWELAIAPLVDDVQVVAGGSTPVLVRVLPVETPLGTPRLFPGETLAVAFEYDGLGVTLSPVMLAAESVPLKELTLTAALDATGGILRAEGSGLVNAMVRSASTPVEILLRRIRLTFETARVQPRGFSGCHDSGRLPIGSVGE